MRLLARRALLFAVAAVATVSIARADLSTGLVGYWTFDEASSGGGTGTASDSSGHGYDGAINGAVYAAGKVGLGALAFDGANDYVDCGVDTPLGLVGTSYTYAYWANWGGNTGSLQRMLQRDDGMDYTGGYASYMWSNNSCMRYVHNGNGPLAPNGHAAYALVTTDGLPVGTWEHVAVVFNYDSVTPANTTLTSYLNGVATGTVSVVNGTSVGFPLADDGNDALYFGGLPGVTQYFKGSLDEIRIYNRVLSGGEVAQLAGVPEPSSLVLLGIGLVGLFAYVWRKRK